MPVTTSRAIVRPSASRSAQLAFGVTCMVMIANLQYGWTLFVRPMQEAHGWHVGQIQIAFSIFIALETWLTPVEGWLADKVGPRLVVTVGGVLVALGWSAREGLVFRSKRDALKGFNATRLRADAPPQKRAA